jgi:hypothetical protein
MALIPYTKIIWVNGQAPAINSVNLANSENGIERVTNAVIDLENQVLDTRLTTIENKFPIADNDLASADENVKGGAMMHLESVDDGNGNIVNTLYINT